MTPQPPTPEYTPHGAVAVIGAGASGTALAALVGQVAPVVIVCRNTEHAAVLRRAGARITGVLCGASLPAVVRSIADLPAAGPIRAAFVATKTTAIPQVADELRAAWPRTSQQPMVVSFQNGIDPGRELIRLLGTDRVLRMVLNFGVVLREPGGVAEATLVSPPSYIGCINPGHRSACEDLAGLLTRGGLTTEFDAALERRVWAKAVLNASMSPVAALVNATVGEVLDSPSRLLVERLLHEAIATARAMGLDLGPDPAAAAWASLERARSHTPSMVEDIRAGRESEVGQLNRQIIEHARTLGVDVPTHEAVDALIETFDWKLYARRRGAGAAVRRPVPAAR